MDLVEVLYGSQFEDLEEVLIDTASFTVVLNDTIPSDICRLLYLSIKTRVEMC